MWGFGDSLLVLGLQECCGQVASKWAQNHWEVLPSINVGSVGHSPLTTQSTLDRRFVDDADCGSLLWWHLDDSSNWSNWLWIFWLDSSCETLTTPVNSATRWKYLERQ